MKKVFGFGFLILMTFGCSPDKHDAGNNPDNNISTTEKEGFFSKPLTPGNTREVEVLISQFWIIEYYINPDNKERNMRSEAGRWYKFAPDGTFTSGQWEEQTGYGSWFLNYREGKTFLMVDNIYNSQDVEWEMQGMTNAGDAMSWVATTKGYKDSGAMVKLIQLLSRPTKAQFGVKD